MCLQGGIKSKRTPPRRTRKSFNELNTSQPTIISPFFFLSLLSSFFYQCLKILARQVNLFLFPFHFTSFR
jgi:hypothetical protein